MDLMDPVSNSGPTYFGIFEYEFLFYLYNAGNINSFVLKTFTTMGPCFKTISPAKVNMCIFFFNKK